MIDNLLELPLKDLLQKIGKGKHVPGSGSVAALNGLLSCQLLTTVLTLTLRKDTIKKQRYNQFESRFKEILLDIETNIRPNLEILFQQDSDEFNDLMQDRFNRRDSENQFERNVLTIGILRKQVRTTETPLLISGHCIQLAEYGIFLFEKAYTVVRGDSGVALSNALTGLHGTINIISLNLVDFPKDKWTEHVHADIERLKKEHKRLINIHEELTQTLQNEAVAKNELKAHFNQLKVSASKLDLIDRNIEKFAIDLQNALWKHRKTIWPNRTSFDKIEILNCKKTTTLIQYAYSLEDTLGHIDDNIEIGGLCDNLTSTISISKQFKPEIINFTAAHELGHALFHTQSILHRDISIGFPSNEAKRPLVEKQADKFAAFFLLPGKIVKQLFVERFETEKLVINDLTAHSLNFDTPEDLIEELKNKRGFSRKIASVELFNRKPFQSLAKRF